ncbi:BolA family protein [Psychrobacter sp. AOP22-C1-22]|uniref:BolA family protein n=1 Tax=unclassified Psychrobacter TaxID=196806 RepID=UPI001788738A|nr:MULTISPECIES: BolA family protein [unclassified Psychrobacter]MDN5802904.1 BolA family transcriptional regulator [Psychrobacter sp.]MBE0407951.1 BolA family transcriptional regulator [Psychrobacter sp. FME6]MBE0446294.1 BolA family transcriptional regulator [Psychrobacter sp. FME5]MDN5892164.1 BolA family transcriptional regulator [Psychrobacter sp.]MDN5898128.1 BolA family transcriptional regulator [Psychrobacter sp.]
MTTTPTADALNNQLQDLQPQHIELTNESMNHAGYFEGKESHFKLVIVSDTFEGKRLVARHQLVYGLANSLLTSQGGQIHALAIHAYTPTEWQGQSPDSPLCAGQNQG